MDVSATSRVAALADWLRTHTPRDERERESTAEIHRELDRLADPFSETADPTHVTISLILLSDGPTVLLHEHKRLGWWMQPGGHIDGNETLLEAVRREGMEEAGLDLSGADLTPVHVDAHDGGRGHRHLDVRFAGTVNGQPDLQPGPGESTQIRWVPLVELPSLTDASCLSAVEAARDRI